MASRRRRASNKLAQIDKTLERYNTVYFFFLLRYLTQAGVANVMRERGAHM